MILFLISVPLSTKMVIELIHHKNMNAKYEITNVSEGFPPTESIFNFKGHIVEIKEVMREEESYTDPWHNKIGIGDLSLEVDGRKLDTLSKHPIRMEEDGLNRYFGEIAYLILEDGKSGESQFIALLKNTRELQKENENGDIASWVPEEKLNYTTYTLDEAGNLTSKSFSFNNRNALQTELLNAGLVTPYAIGYYTDAWEAYPSVLFPLVFPFVTLIAGFTLIIIFLPVRRAKK